MVSLFLQPTAQCVWPARRNAWHVVLGLVLLFSPFLTAHAQDTRSLETVMSGVAAELAQRFPALSGEVAKVEGDQIYLSLGARDNVVEGMQLTLVREGEPLKRPTTGEALGRLEETLGIVTVGQVFERYAVASAVFFKGKDNVRVGDKVRISAGRIALGILPLVVQTRQPVPHEELASTLQQALETTGRFRVVSRDQVSIWLLKRGVGTTGVVPPDVLPELAQALQCTYVLQTLVKDLRGTTIIEALLLIPSQPQTPIVTASAIVPATALVRRPEASVVPQVAPVPAVPPLPVAGVPPAPAPVATPLPIVGAPAGPPSSPQVTAPPPAPKLEGVFKNAPAAQGAGQWNLADTMTELHKMPGAVIAADASDLDGDGKAEVVTMDALNIALFRLEEGRLVRVDTYASRRSGKLLSVQLLRLGSAGNIGIVVNRQVADSTLDSFILTLQGQKLTMWREHLDDILLAVDTDGDGVKDTLWGQPFDRAKFFRRGTIRQYAVTGETLEQLSNLSVTDNFRATGAVLAKLGTEGVPNLVFIDSGRHIRIYRGDEELWRSRDSVGGGPAEAELERTIGRDKSRESYFFEAIPATVDIDGDGIQEVLVARNAAFLGGFIPNLNQYSGGDVMLLRQERFGFGLTSVSPEFNGIVSGVAVIPGNPRAVFLSVTKSKGFLKGTETTLFLSRLP